VNYDKFKEMFDSGEAAGKRFWICGLQFGKDGISRFARNVEPTEIVIEEVQQNSRWRSCRDGKWKLRKISKKTGKILNSDVPFKSSWSTTSGIEIFETEKDCLQFWEKRNMECAIELLAEAADVAECYLTAFEKCNNNAGSGKMDREDALAILRI
jgi:hypothetical protein